MDRFGV
jgi:hypothetical protein